LTSGFKGIGLGMSIPLLIIVIVLSVIFGFLFLWLVLARIIRKLWHFPAPAFIQPRMLAQLENKLSRPENQDITNIKLIQASAYELPFADAFLDLVYMITVLQEIPDRHKALLEARRVLKPAGILAITEFFPDPDYPLKRTTIKQATGAGFVDAKVLGNFWNYTARFIKPKESICL